MLPVKHGVLALGDGNIEFIETGHRRPGHPVVVLLHEGLGCAALWKDFPHQLAAALNCCVFAYSRFGYGASSPVRLPRPPDFMHTEALAILPQVLAGAKISRALLIGHSDGASIAAIYAGAAPEPACAGLVLMAPHFFVEDISIRSIEKARVAYLTGNLKSRLETYHGANVDNAFLGWNGAWLSPEFAGFDITGYLDKIKVPVLGLQGTGDEYGTAAHIAALKDRCTAPVAVAMLDECGHSPHRDQPELTLQAITGFCRNYALLESNKAP